MKDEETQTGFRIHQIGVNVEAYNIITAIKRQLMKKYKRTFSFSDAIMELRDRADLSSGDNIKFTEEETILIKEKLQGKSKIWSGPK